mmetsp:Transcript_30411/g.41857  ORF Transcript_30411/g.41857 Transcript_30411/m.41857 type:complete len:205 (-) Transcript_30411:469-1083(-)
MALVHCGHTFCSGCLDTLLNGTNDARCPICRSEIQDNTDLPPSQLSHQPFTNTEGTDTTLPASDPPAPQDNTYHPPASAPHSPGRGPSSCAQNFAYPTNLASSYWRSPFASRAPEIRFRMNRIHEMFPDVMTLELLRAMNSAVDRNSLHDFRYHASVRGVQTRQSIASMRETTSSGARASGRSGASRSFGGGRSRGGGGGGGSW